MCRLGGRLCGALLFGRTRSMSGDRGVEVSGGAETAPSINLKVNFEFDSARLDNESMLTLDVLGRALSSDALKGQAIEIVGHTDAKGTVEYNDAPLTAARGGGGRVGEAKQ